MTSSIVENIAAAIAFEYPGVDAPAIAEQLVASAESDGIPSTALITWIHDKPRHDLSLRAWRDWCGRYNFATAPAVQQ